VPGSAGESNRDRRGVPDRVAALGKAECWAAPQDYKQSHKPYGHGLHRSLTICRIGGGPSLTFIATSASDLFRYYAGMG
jgi:hypothetical protein